MKKNILLFLLTFTLTFSAVSQQKKILFVGNSYSRFNEMPMITYNIAESTGNGFIYDQHTPSSQRFLDHAVNEDLEDKINSQDWDFITLQGQSLEVALTGTFFDTEVAPFAAQLVDKIRANNTCTQPVFFRTWGRENGITNCENYPWVCTYEGMDDALAQNYQILTEQNNALLAPVGDVWRYLRENHPNIDLYHNDGSHPSPTGSYVVAMTFYTVLFNNNPEEVTYNYELSETTANIIKSAVKLIVYDQINVFDFTAYFTESINNNTVDFSFNTLTDDAYLWDFGDGSTSNASNPSHTYNALGDYQVTLTLTRCGQEHTITKTISITTLSIETFSLKNLSIYPNPTFGNITLKGLDHNTNLVLYNLLGQKVKSFSNNSEHISISECLPGTYFLKISNTTSTKIIKLIKL